MKIDWQKLYQSELKRSNAAWSIIRNLTKELSKPTPNNSVILVPVKDEELISDIRCPICGQRYNVKNIGYYQEYTTCKACGEKFWFETYIDFFAREER